MPVAIFILLAMGVFALKLGRTIAQTAALTPQELISVNAFYAADSAAQYALRQIFYSGAATLTRAAADGACNAVDGGSLGYAGAGLNNCRVGLACTIASDAANSTSFYTVTSAATCTLGAVSAQRSVQVSAFMQ